MRRCAPAVPARHLAAGDVVFDTGLRRRYSLRALLGFVAAAAVISYFASTYPAAGLLVLVLACLAFLALGLSALLRRAGWVRVVAYYLVLLCGWIIGEAALPGPAESLPYLFAFAVTGLTLVGLAWVAQHRPARLTHRRAKSLTESE